jgi:indolepyruvate ferredoxin oxidoreductase
MGVVAARPGRPDVTLEDKYALDQGQVLLGGTQALVRLLLEQSASDAAAGLNTAGFVSGYRGSPLGGFDIQLGRARRRLEAARIRFEPGVNEELAATAICGTQQLSLLPGARYQGVFALWYGKGPGVDRAGDAIKHGNRLGTTRYGGVLLAFGDDHPGKSSTIAHHSEPALAANGLPVLYPAHPQELIEFGLFGYALSRYTGLWVGLKCVNEAIEASRTVDLGAARPRIVRPDDPDVPVADAHAHLRFEPQADEVRLMRVRLPLALAFAGANCMDRVTHDAQRRGLGIVAAGKSWLDVSEALRLLHLDEQRCAQLGVRVYKPGMIWPLEASHLVKFSLRHRELLFVEEKAPFLESQAAVALYALPHDARPRLVGKSDERGLPLLPADIAVEPLELALAIAARLAVLGIADTALVSRAAVLREVREATNKPGPDLISRTPYFCPGCPHNTSTKVPDGSLALAGIGCHGMAMSMNRSTLPPTQMGGEGANWIGMAPFTATAHVFQNLGDGTYFHSGLLAIRAAVAARVNMTYKLLYNDAVAMTGGQPVEGGLSVAEITHQLAAERVTRIAVVSDDVRKYGRKPGFAARTTVHGREYLHLLQQELRNTPGVSVLLYDQVCAAEKRRRRKRGQIAAAHRRVFINSLVCEGCGDCSVQSNCVAIEPLETARRRIEAVGGRAQADDGRCTELLQAPRLQGRVRGREVVPIQRIPEGARSGIYR